MLYEVITSKKTVASFTRKDFVDFMQKFYVANDTVVCVTGIV